MDNLNGHPRHVSVTTASAGAATTSVNLRPDSGKIWKILSAVGFQASGGARNGGWYVTDPENPGGVNHSGTVALNSAQRLVLGAVAAATVPFSFESWWATQDHYFTFLWSASGAGENGYVFAEVLEYSATGKQA